MSRLANFILALALIALVVIALDPNARQKAVAFVEKWNDRIALGRPVVTDTDTDSDKVVATPIPTSTPNPTAVAGNDDEIIPNTGGDEEPASDKPIIQVNWDALSAALRRFWDELRNIKIDLNPRDNK